MNDQQKMDRLVGQTLGLVDDIMQGRRSRPDLIHRLNRYVKILLKAPPPKR